MGKYDNWSADRLWKRRQRLLNKERVALEKQGKLFIWFVDELNKIISLNNREVK